MCTSARNLFFPVVRHHHQPTNDQFPRHPGGRIEELVAQSIRVVVVGVWLESYVRTQRELNYCDHRKSHQRMDGLGPVVTVIVRGERVVRGGAGLGRCDTEKSPIVPPGDVRARVRAWVQKQKTKISLT